MNIPPEPSRRKVVWGRQFAVAALVALLAAAVAPDVSAQTRVTAAWNANADSFTAGYRVYVGHQPGRYLADLDVGRSTTVALDLPMGAVYHIAVRGYDAQGRLGMASDEITVDLAAVPNPPEAPSATVANGVATLAWGRPNGGGAPLEYLVSVGTSPGATNLLNGFNVGHVFSASGALPPGTYFARVHAENIVGIGPPSSEVAIQVGTALRLQGPTGLVFRWEGANGLFSWAAPSAGGGQAPSGYVLEAGSAPGRSDIASIAVGAATSFRTAIPAGTYFVRVRGVSGAASSDPSNEIVVRGVAPGAPTNLAASGNGASVSLQWVAPAGSPVQAYILEAGTGPGRTDIGTLNVGAVTSFSTTAAPGIYYVRVRAMNGQGVGAPSNEIVVRR